ASYAPIISGAITNNGGFTKTGAGTLTQAGAMSGDGALTVAEGTLKLTAQNTRTGWTTSESPTNGATTIASGATLDILSPTGRLYNNDGNGVRVNITVNGALKLRRYGWTEDSLGHYADGSNFTVAGGTLETTEVWSTNGIINCGAGGATFNFAQGATFGTDRGVVTTNGGFTKTGAGTLTFPSAASLSGSNAITIAGGTIAFNNPTVSNAITVGAGATIKGTANLSGAVTFNDGAKIDASANELRLTNANAPTISGTVAVIPNAGAVKGSYIVKCSGTPDAATAEKLMVPGWSVTAVTTAGSTGYTLGLGVGDLPKPKEGDPTVYTPEAARELAVMATKAGATSVTSVTAKTATGSTSGKLLSAAEASAALGCFSNIASASVT
ncbi:MAG: hypothetical protein RR417_07485, partial [Kiritimatiellia bacterium]